MTAVSADATRGVHAKGKPVELYIASYCMLASRGQLSVSTSFIDDEGVDLVFNRWGSTATLAIQVKSRFTDSVEVQRGDFTADVTRSTFQARDSYYVLFAVVDPEQVRIGPLWLVPSRMLDPKSPHREKIRFKANIRMFGQESGQWHDQEVWDLASLPGRLLSILGSLDPAGVPSDREALAANQPMEGDGGE